MFQVSKTKLHFKLEGLKFEASTTAQQMQFKDFSFAKPRYTLQL
jgi:hypothetical protein